MASADTVLDPPKHWLDGAVMPAMAGVAIALSLFQLWQGVTADLGATFFRPIHLSWILVLIFLKFPTVKSRASTFYLPGRLIDLTLCLLLIYAGMRVVEFDYAGIDHLL